MTEKRPWHLSDVSLADVRAQPYQAAVLTFGATEPHNLHLPHGTDNIEVIEICERACAQAWERGARVALLPNIPFGAEQNVMEFPLAINVEQEILNQIVASVAKSLERHGVMKLVIVNGHGGNDFKACLRTLMGRTSVFCCAVNWYGMMADEAKKIFEHPGDHADEMETSLILATAPHLVDMSKADAGAIKQSRFEAVRKGWVYHPRAFDKLTTNCGVGDPRQASAEKGRKYLEIVTQRLSDFIVELAQAPMDRDFPFHP